MKIKSKKILYILACLIPVAFVCMFIVPWKKEEAITCLGSSSIKPFIEEFAKKYNNEIPKKYDVTCEGGGSGYGISQVITGYTDVGLASKNTFGNAKNSQKEWENKQVKTVTLGWEGICLIYIPPKGISDFAINNINKLMTITDCSKDGADLNSSSILNLYYAFSGFASRYNQEACNNYTLDWFISKNANLSNDDLSKFKQTKITPYVRSGGSKTSGTAAAFYTNSHFDNFEQQKKVFLTKNQQSAFESGDYGHDIKVIDTDEANSRAWDAFSKNNIPGSIIYLSSGFVQENWELITKKHYGIFQYNDIEYNVDNIENGYNFFRPLNAVVSLSPIENKIKDFISWLVFVSKYDDWKNKGVKKVNDKEVASMLYNGDTSKHEDLFNNKSSDIELMIKRGQSWDTNSTIFGCEEIE